MSLYSPLDLFHILVIDLAGTPEVFTFVAMLLVSFFLGRYNFPNKVNISLFVLFTVMMATYMAGIYVLVILLAGLATFYAVAKFSK